MAAVTVSAAVSLLEECLQAVKTPITSVWRLQNGKLIMKLQQKIAVAASLILCTLSEQSSSFGNTCFLTKELPVNC